jgi:hypothetical protein
MPKMRATVAASHFNAAHAMTEIFMLNETVGHWLPKTRPTATGVKFTVGGKQWFSAANAMINTLFGAIRVLAGEGRFSTFFAADMKLFSRQFFPPLLFAVVVICHDFFLDKSLIKLLYVLRLFLYNGPHLLDKKNISIVNIMKF